MKSSKLLALLKTKIPLQKLLTMVLIKSIFDKLLVYYLLFDNVLGLGEVVDFSTNVDAENQCVRGALNRHF